MEKKFYSDGVKKDAKASPSLPKSNRRLVTLRKKNDFDRLFQAGKKINVPLLLVRWIPNDLPNHRVAFMISHKVSKKAVIRNKLRRRLLEITKAALSSSVRSSFDVLFIALPGLEKKSFADLKTSVENTLAKISGI